NDQHSACNDLSAARKSYFTDTELYINRDGLLELCQQGTRNSMSTQVDVRKVRNSKDDKVYEIAKYSAKDSDYLINQEVFEVFYKALKGKRLIDFSGLFKEARKKFEDGDLDQYKEKDLTKYVYAIMYNWGQKNYIEKEKRLLTEEEQKEINGQLLDEKDVE